VHWPGGAASRLRHSWELVLPVLALGLFFAAPALATPIPPTPNPLPGSSFQGGDGNQTDAVPNVDWQGLSGAGRVLHSLDANDEDTAFTNGTKENEPGSWDLTLGPGGVNPSDANIRDAWSAVEQGGADAFLYSAFARETAKGSTFITFELNHDSRLWFNGLATIPCRRDGDVLVSYEAGGRDVDVVLQRWITLETHAPTGCATRGRLDTLTGVSPNADAQGAVNAAAITTYLPGAYAGSIPAERFGEAALNLTQILDDAINDGCFSFGSIWMHSRSSLADSANMQDYVAPRSIALRSCAASGAKFHDLDGDGMRDSGEPGLPRWLIWADYDNDGVRDAVEPFGITDNEGQYVINDIRPPDRTYMLRETISNAAGRRRAARAGVVCSYPNASTQGGTGSAPGGLFHCAWGPIDSATTAYARGRDFGNYGPARLTVLKQLEPSTDPGRFDVLVNGVVVVAAAGDGAGRAIVRRPGAYTVSETPTVGTNPNDYRSTVDCKRGTRRTQTRSGPVFANLQLSSGDVWTCTFVNVRSGWPAIAIDKAGPSTATAGDTLRYRLYVTNPGHLPFQAASVRVLDPGCDEPPLLIGKRDGVGPDHSPATLDVSDTWAYACAMKTSAPPDCTPSLVPNTATVIGAAGGRTVSDSSSIKTTLGCPPEPPIPPNPQPQPPQPQPPQPQPTPPPSPSPPPSPVVPPGPVPPDAGDAAVAGGVFRKVTAACIRTRVPRVRFHGTRIARVQVYVDGRLRRALNVHSLQSRLTPRVTLLPGSYSVKVRVWFQRGTGSSPVTLATRTRICTPPRAAPAFTG
jgi:hypothetical protein